MQLLQQCIAATAWMQQMYTKKDCSNNCVNNCCNCCAATRKIVAAIIVVIIAMVALMQADRSKLEAFEMWIWRRMEKIS